MKELKEPCKSAIANNRCIGCTGLGEADWKEPKVCPYIATAQDYMKQIKLNLGVEKQWKK